MLTYRYAHTNMHICIIVQKYMHLGMEELVVPQDTELKMLLLQ